MSKEEKAEVPVPNQNLAKVSSRPSTAAFTISVLGTRYKTTTISPSHSCMNHKQPDSVSRRTHSHLYNVQQRAGTSRIG